jgi:uncharacterized protein (TIGR03000 family)
MRSPGYTPPATTTDEAPTGARTGDDAAHLLVHVAPDADLWFEGMPTEQRGASREFVSPRLPPGEVYHYQIEARWMVGDRTVNVRKRVIVHANDWLKVDLTRPTEP